MSAPADAPADAPPAAAAAAAGEPSPGRPLYHERQQAALCGVHALNTLLQGPYFTEWDLAEVAAELDAAEAALMAGGAGGAAAPDFLRFAAEASGNVDASGMFSVQVLERALEVYGLAAAPAGAPGAGAGPAAAEAAFLLNLREHWFAIRNVEGRWWNFNSLFEAPEELSDFYLAAFLAGMREEGYSVFAIRGELPRPHPEAGDNSTLPEGAPGRWLSAAEARGATAAREELKRGGFAAAAAAGLRSAAPGRKRGASGSPPREGGGDDDADLAAALAASLSDAPGGGGGGAAAPRGGAEADADADLAAAIAASLRPASPAAAAAPAAELRSHPIASMELPALGEEPPAGLGVLAVAVRLPGSGARHARRFPPDATLGHVAALAREHGAREPFQLATSFPRRVLDDWTAPLAGAGLAQQEVLTVEPAPAASE